LADRPELASLAAALAPQLAVTSAVVYPEAWWRAVGLAAGYSVTDMPVRHVRHYGTESWRTGVAKFAAVMSYSDGDHADFWRGLLPAEPNTGWIAPGHPVARELHRQMSEIFGEKIGRSLPQPIGAFACDWKGSFSGAAFHLWAAGSQPERSMADALNPLPGRPLHICGEAWSMRQGWIEGALETVDALLERYTNSAKAAAR
jgi:monoamine oxidase